MIEVIWRDIPSSYWRHVAPGHFLSAVGPQPITFRFEGVGDFRAALRVLIEACAARPEGVPDGR